MINTIMANIITANTIMANTITANTITANTTWPALHGQHYIYMVVARDHYGNGFW